MAFRPIVTICGTTGVGKSKLAIELALHMDRLSNKSGWRGAKVINADSMQVYKGLDVITNKVPEPERLGVSHLLMDFKQPGEQYVVGEWIQDALKLIDEMHERHELPIIVGGTSYWIQHLIFPNRLSQKYVALGQVAHANTWSPELQNSMASLPPDLLALLTDLPLDAPSAKLDPDKAFSLHALLCALDPMMAKRWHWKDTRKVLRNLEILKETRKRPSDIIVEQSKHMSDSRPRFHTLCFWLYADPLTLNNRLDARVDDMITQGLVDEVRSLRDLANIPFFCATESSKNSPHPDYTLGIYQSIGYREFCSYLDEPSEKSFKDAVERMKISTRQYAKRQISWMRNKLLPATSAANENNKDTVPFYLLDTSESDWSCKILKPAIEIQDSFLAQECLPDPKSLSETASRLLNITPKDVSPVSVLKARTRRICHICTTQENRPVMLEEGTEWVAHEKTRSHQRLASKLDQNERC